MRYPKASTWFAAVSVVALMSLSGLAEAVPAKPAAKAAAPTGWEAQSASYKRLEGLFPLYIDAAGGRVLMQLPPADATGQIAEVIHSTIVKQGIGSALIGLDRGAFGDSRLLVFSRVGAKVVARYQSGDLIATGSALEAKAAADAFADSTVWAATPVATLKDGSVIVDIAGLLTRDAAGMRDGLNGSGQGSFRQVADLTLVDTAATKAFPDNLELEALFTFAVDNPGREIANIAPDPSSVSLTLHHSFVRLPDAGYKTREFDPRTAENDVLIRDYSAPLGKPIVTRLAQRFRLEKIDPTAERSRVKKPIVFYIDNSAPEPVRSALKDGAQWWAQAFEAAGYIDAYKVEILPDNVDPMDVRYNVVFWVDRLTRGWSYGQTVTDPRTGEIVRGAVLLGSQRVRQNIIMFEAMAGVDNTGKGGPNDPVEIALARQRQLAAHEVGHALGFQHNFAGSTQGRTTVLDYPTALIDIKDGKLDFSNAYATGIGAWDKVSVDALYGKDEGLKERIKTGTELYRFRADIDGRSPATGNPYASIWDNGDDPVTELGHIMAVRRVALDGFGLHSLPEGAAVTELRRRLVPVFLYQRYQVNATAKLIGGADYAFPLKGQGGESARVPVPVAKQAEALTALIKTLKPSELVLTDAQLSLLSAQTTGGSDPQNDVEVFASRTGRAFDPGMAAEVSAEVTLQAVFAPERLNRLTLSGTGGETLALSTLIDQVTDAVFMPQVSGAAEAEAARRVQLRTALMLGRLAGGNSTLSSTAAALISAKTEALSARLKASRNTDATQKAHDKWLGGLLGDSSAMAEALKSGRYEVRIPPGEPI